MTEVFFQIVIQVYSGKENIGVLLTGLEPVSF